MLLTPGVRAAEFSAVQVGYQRQAQVGTWMPVQVSASELPPGESGSLLVTTVDARGNSVEEICDSGTVSDDGLLSLQGLARTGRLDRSMKIELVNSQANVVWCSADVQCSDEIPDTQPDPVQKWLRIYRHDVRFLLTIGQPAGIDSLMEQSVDISEETPPLVTLSVDSADQLPADARTYELFSSMLLTGPVLLTDEQFQMIRNWVHGGGHLIVCCSDGVPTLLQSSLGQWLHSHFDIMSETRVVTDADLGALQQIVPQARRISTLRRTVNMAQIRSKQPVYLAESTNGPLVARVGSGGGKMTFVTVNLNAAPLSSWPSLADCYAVLLVGAPLRKAAGQSGSSRISSSGIGDLTTQLMATVDPIPHSGRWTAWSVIGLAFGWLLLIGPLDYLLVVVLMKRPHLTWFTFPLWVVLGFVGLYTLKSDDPVVTLNSVHLVDVVQDKDTQSLRNLSLLSLSTPATSRATLKAVPNPVFSGSDPHQVFSWAGRPDDVYGGMYRATGIGRGGQSYSRDVADPATLTSVPLLIDGSFETQSQWSVQASEPLVEAKLSVSGFGLLNGSFAHHLPVPLRDWVVVFGNRIYRPRDDARVALPAGQTWTFRQGGSQIIDLKAYLTGSRPAREAPLKAAPGQSEMHQGYSTAGRDPLDIVTIMSLYEVAGADGYTGVNHNTLHQMDMSDSIRLNYALIIGWMDTSMTELEVDGTLVTPASSITVTRFLVPVDRRPADASAMTASALEEAENAARKAAKEASRNKDSSNGDNDQ